MKRESCEGVLTFWAGELGTNVPELLAPNVGVNVRINSDIQGVMVFRRGEDVRIAASSSKVETMRASFSDLSVTDFCLPEFWRNMFPEFCGAMVGPELHYYMDAIPSSWTPAPASRSLVLVRGLAASDMKVCAEFAGALTQQEREASGLDVLGRQAWGVFVQGVLVAIAGYDAWPNRVAHIGVATHPEYRGRKFAQLAVQAAVRGAAMRRCIAQFRCLAVNEAASGVALALGFPLFAETLFIHQPSRG